MAVKKFSLADAASVLMQVSDLSDTIDGYVESMDEVFPPGWELAQAATKMAQARESINSAVGFLQSGLGAMYVDAVGNSRPTDVAQYEYEDLPEDDPSAS